MMASSPRRRPGRPGVRGPRGVVLYVVCLLLLGGLLLTLALSRFTSGAVEQLARTVDQTRLLVHAQAGLHEMLARIKTEANQPQSEFGKMFRQVFTDRSSAAGAGAAPWSRRRDFPPADLPLANALIREALGPSARLEGSLRLVLPDRLASPLESYAGFLELTARAAAGSGRDTALSVRERREVRLLDVRDPFFDKYALFVKNDCPHLNHPERRLVVEGVDRSDFTSFAYFGNRLYPPCPEFPQGEGSPKPPPVLLDLDFEGDGNLIANLAGAARGFSPRDAAAAQQSRGQLFFVKEPPVAFAGLAGQYGLADYAACPDLQRWYERTIVDPARKAGGGKGSLASEIVQDFNQCRGDLAKSEGFRAVLADACREWRYHYGYTDYGHLVGLPGLNMTPFATTPLFSGILSYFHEYRDYNPQRTLGGRMPALFGPARNRPLFVEGPVYLRFFKVAFLDQVTIDLALAAGKQEITLPGLPLAFQRADRPVTYRSKVVANVDGLEKVLMSRAIQTPLNYVFFGARTAEPEPRQAGTPRPAADLAPQIDRTLRLPSYLYKTAGDFLAERVVTEGGRRVLDLDGLMVILGLNGKVLDLSDVHLFRGKGVLVVGRGDCRLGSLRRLVPGSDDLCKIQLQRGIFQVDGAEADLEIEAGLTAIRYFPKEGETAHGLLALPPGRSVRIHGNLLVDDLNRLDGLQAGRTLTVRHDPTLTHPADPFRVSIGPVKTLFAVQAE